jgi:CRISPR type IV-associated protein Csf2
MHFLNGFAYPPRNNWFKILRNIARNCQYGLHIPRADAICFRQVKCIPYFPANDLRGRLHRKGASRLMEIWKKKGQSISEALYLGLTCGASSGNPENDKTVEEVLRANSNVYMGVFGGGTRLLRSAYSVQDMEVICQPTIDARIVPAHYGESMEGGFVPSEYRDGQKLPIRDGYKLLHTYNILRVDDIMRATRVDEMAGIIEGGSDAIIDYQTAVLAERSDTKEAKEAAKEAKKTGSKTTTEVKAPRMRVENMQNFRAVAPGIPMYFRMDMKDYISSSQAGFLILCLKDLLEEGEFGGYVRCGLGKMDVKEMKIVTNGTAYAMFKDNSLELSEKAAALAATAQAELEKLTVQEMELFFSSTKGE